MWCGLAAIVVRGGGGVRRISSQHTALSNLATGRYTLLVEPVILLPGRPHTRGREGDQARPHLLADALRDGQARRQPRHRGKLSHQSSGPVIVTPCGMPPPRLRIACAAAGADSAVATPIRNL